MSIPIANTAIWRAHKKEHLLGMELTNQGLIGFAGGEPVFVGDEMQGAIGISGGTAEQDAAIAGFTLTAV